MNYRMLIQYDGTRYNGWQRQQSTDNTIQGKIEDALSRMTGTEVEIHGAGRTDSGVHALGQVANVHLNPSFSAEEIRSYLNTWLPLISWENMIFRASAPVKQKNPLYAGWIPLILKNSR